MITLDVMQVNNRFVASYLPGKPSAWTADPPGKAESKPEPTRAPYPDWLNTGWRWAAWGVDDMLPTNIRCKIEKVPMAAQATYKLIAMMYGNGLCYYRNSDLHDGDNKVQRAYEPEIEDFLRRNYVRQRWLIPQFADYRYYINTFSELILSMDRRQITGIYHKGAEFCRLTEQNPATLQTEYLLFSYEFPYGISKESDIRRIPLYQWDDEERFFNRLQGYKFAWHSYFHSPGSVYYGRPFWLGLFRQNGWVDASISVPEIVNAMMRNQISLKYQILIPETYFEIRYPEWNTFTAPEREKLINELVDFINDNLVGTTNAFRSISTVFKQDPITGAPLGKIEIISIDDKIKKDNWVPSSNTADAQIVQGLGLHPSQVGLAPEGGKMGAGSGSDQRESFNTGITLNTLDQELVLEPLNFIARYNAKVNPKWDVTFFIDHTYHTTTNEAESGLAPSDITLQLD